MQNHVVVEEIIIRPKKMTLHHEKCINFRAWVREGTFRRFELPSFILIIFELNKTSLHVFQWSALLVKNLLFWFDLYMISIRVFQILIIILIFSNALGSVRIILKLSHSMNHCSNYGWFLRREGGCCMARN